MRCFVLDNHRPLHLANVYSRHSVVVFDDTYSSYEDMDDEAHDIVLPSDGSVLSCEYSSSDSDTSSSEDDDDDELDDVSCIRFYTSNLL